MSVLGERRSYMEGSRRRAQILRCAREVFAERGFHVTSVADICQAAQIGRGTLYQYFDNKHAVLLAVIEDVAQRVRTVVEQRTPMSKLTGAQDAPLPLIQAFCERRLHNVLAAVFIDEATLRLLLRNARGLDNAVDELLQRVDSVLMAAIVEELNTAVQLGLVACDDVELAAQFILGGVEKMVLAALRRDEPLDMDRIVRVAVRLQLMGLLSDEARARGRAPQHVKEQDR